MTDIAVAEKASLVVHLNAINALAATIVSAGGEVHLAVTGEPLPVLSVTFDGDPGQSGPSR